MSKLYKSTIDIVKIQVIINLLVQFFLIFMNCASFICHNFIVIYIFSSGLINKVAYRAAETSHGTTEL